MISHKKPELEKHLKQIQDEFKFFPDSGLQAPTPVFFCTIETYSESTQKQLEIALKNLQREDPSLRVRTDDQTGQLILLGMGELHIEIIRDRLKREYHLETYLGPLNVNYRETIEKTNQQTIVWNSHINDKHSTISITMSIEPLTNINENQIVSFSQIKIVRTEEQTFDHLRKDHIGTSKTRCHRFSSSFYFVFRCD